MLGTGQIGTIQLGATPYEYAHAQAQAYITNAKDQNFWSLTQAYITNTRDQNFWSVTQASIGYFKDDIAKTELLLIKDIFQITGENLAGFSKNTGTSDPGYISDNRSGWLHVRFADDCTVQIDTNGSAYDTMLALFSGTPGSLTPIARDDDSGDGLNSFLTANVTGNVDYYIEVSSYFGGSDLTNLRITSPQFPIGIRTKAQAQGYISPAFDQNLWGQAMAFVGPLWVAQAQAKIKTYGIQQYTQAQASIRVRVFAQAQGSILVRQLKFSQASFLIMPIWANAQAEAFIYQINPWPEYMLSQAQGYIRPFLWAQAQAYISPATGQQVYAVAQATINQSMWVAQAQAKIALFAFAQAQACIIGNSFAQAEAFIDQPNPWTEYALAISQAYIRAYNQKVYSQANAWIGLPAITTIFSDSFSRIDNSGTWGSPDIGNPYTFTWTSGTSTWTIDGSVGKVTVPQYSYGGKDLYLLKNGSEYFHDFEMYMEIRYTGLTYPYTGSGYPSSYWLFRDINSNWRYGAYFYFTNNGSYAYMEALYGGQTGTYYSAVNYNYTIWNAIKFKFEGANMYMKFWPLTDPEPQSWILSATLTNTLDINAAGAIVFEPYINYPQSGEGTVEVDNIRITGAGISLYNQGYAQAQTTIKTSYQQYSQAFATINIAERQVIAQANSSIKSYPQKYSQAQARILKSAAYAQARAFIPTKTTRRVFSQGRSIIRRTDTPFAFQAYTYTQASIKSRFFLTFSQANALLITPKFAQARAWIIPPTAVAQAQASIKQTYPKDASYQDAVIKATPVAYWPLDDGPTTFREVIANNTGTLGGAGAYPVNGLRGNMTGIQWLAGGRRILTNFYQPSTSVAVIEAWFATTGIGEIYQGRYSESGNSSGRGISLTLSNPGFGCIEGRLNFFINSDNIFWGRSTNIAYNDGNPHHVVAVWRSSIGTPIDYGQFHIYVDGYEVGVYATGTAGSFSAPATGNTNIPNKFLGNTYGDYNGWLANLAIYAHDLTDAQILDHASIGLSGTPAGMSNPIAQALAYIGHFSYAQANAYIKVEGIQTYSQAMSYVGPLRFAQAISQVTWDVLGYRKAVLLDDPILYYPLDESEYGDGKLHSIVGRADAPWDTTGATFGVLGSLAGGVGNTAIQFNGRYGTKPDTSVNFSRSGSYPLIFPGPQGTNSGANQISKAFWGRAGDSVIITITQQFSSGNLGIWQDGGENNFPWGTSNLTPGTYTITLTQTGVHYIYSWSYNSGKTGAGTWTYVRATPSGNDESYIPAEPGDAVTVEFWMKWDGSDNAMPVTFGSTTIWFNSGYWGFNTGHGDIWGMSSSGLANRWVHVAAVFYSGEVAQAPANPNKLYLNGVLQTLAQYFTWPYNSVLTQNFTIGYGGSYPWYGGLDEFAIFNKELTAEQILTHYQARTQFARGQAQGYMRAFDQNLWSQAMSYVGPLRFAQAQASIRGIDVPQWAQSKALITRNGEGLVWVAWESSAYENQEQYFTNWGVLDAPNEPNYASDSALYVPGFDGTNGGVAWTARFIADRPTGLWWFQISVDDGADLWIDNTQLINVGWGSRFSGESGYISGSITLNEGQEYNLHTRFGQGGGPYVFRARYKRPEDTSWYYLTDNRAPWIKYYSIKAFAQANADIKQRYPFSIITGTNYATVANGASASAASTYSGSPSYVIDENDTTAWSSNNPIVGTWIKIDLGQSRIIGGYKIYPVNYNATATLQYSTNDFDWTDYASIQMNGVNGDPAPPPRPPLIGAVPAISARYWRLYCTNGGTWNGFGLVTFGLYDGASLIGSTLAQAQATIWIPYTRYYKQSQAQAYISPSFNQRVYGQAQASIKATYRSYAQAQALMTWHWAFAQAQAKLISRVKLSSQANAWIIPPTAIAFAQASIKRTYTLSFQAQAVAGHLHHSQAQVYISPAFDQNVWGQAQALMDSTRLWSQAQAQIVAVGKWSSQARAYIYTYLFRDYWKHSQARAVIGHQHHAQALALIGHLTYSQAHASIRTTYRVMSQAQAWAIPTTIITQAQGYMRAFDQNVWGQAEATIETSYRQYSQADSWIIPPTATAQAEASIKHTYRVYTQANTWIIPPTTISNAQAWMHAYGIQNYSQAALSVKRKYYVRSQARAYITYPRAFAQAKTQIVSPNQWGSGQAIAQVGHVYVFQAAAYIHKSAALGQAESSIKQTYRAYAQAAASIWYWQAYAQAIASIEQTFQVYSQALALMIWHFRLSQAQARIIRIYDQPSQAQARILRTYEQHTQALASIYIRYNQPAQARALVVSVRRAYAYASAQVGAFWPAQSQARVISFNVPRFAQAVAYIIADINVVPPTPSSDRYTYLVRYNNHTLPGYAQNESYDSQMNITTNYAAYMEASLSEYIGLQNKNIDMVMKVWEENYYLCKQRVQEAATIFRSMRGFAKLYIQHYDKYYLALATRLSTEKSVGSSTKTLDYNITFEAKPWLISNDIQIISGTGLIDTGARPLSQGGWTPTIITVTGTDVSINAYTEYGQPAGNITIAGPCTDFVIDTEAFATTDNSIVTTKDYAIYVGPGKTYFDITGATSCTIQWQNRWYL